MEKISLNSDWLFAQGTITMMDLFMENNNKIQQVDLPHDAMIYRERSKDTANAHQTGFYPGGEYTYIKQWEVPAEWAGHVVQLEFEGVADTCRIYLNGELVAINYNPYSGIFVDVSEKIKYGETNELKVEVRSVEQSSRWYSGAGLYRPVSAWVGEQIFIPMNGTKITTVEASSETAVVEIEVPICNKSQMERDVMLLICLEDAEGKIAAAETVPVSKVEKECRQRVRLTVDEPKLWSDVHPNLYTCRVELSNTKSCEQNNSEQITQGSGNEGSNVIDSTAITFGIRMLRLNAKQGLLVNGCPVKLRGTCIHHDNGIIGAATFADAEYRRCAQMKAAGFNAIRSAHHPMSKAMLEACDKLGMYVMDELSDMWTRTKNPHDYANYFANYWKQDLGLMIEKDYNHPSVILYSTGNEIPEAGAPCGREWNRKINEEIKRLDATRYTTSGINGLMAGSDRMMEIIAQASGMTPEQLMAMQEPQLEADQAGADAETGASQAGADAVNGMAMVMVGPLADAIATSPIMEEVIGEFASVTDIAGYNYLTGLHEEDHKRHPSRVVLGTETFPADIVNLWDIVKRNPHVLGDFTWTGYDYIGEAGCGIFHYDGGENFSAHWPDRLAGIGDIDILGDRKPISYLRQAVYGIGNEPYIAVFRMDKAGKNASKTPWMWKDNIASWTWRGYEGQMASVDVYANADEVELFLNGESLGKQTVADTFVATYEVAYAPGELVAVSYIDGKEVGRHALKTVGEPKQLAVEVESAATKIQGSCTDKMSIELPADGESLAFLKIRLVDAEGNFNPQETVAVTVEIEGNVAENICNSNVDVAQKNKVSEGSASVVLQGFGSADPSCEGSYQDQTWNTYDGTVMAVLRATRNLGEAIVSVSVDGFETKRIIFTVN